MALIILIEDDARSAELVIKVLTPHEHQILHAADGVTGLRLIHENKPDLILLDLDLPDLDGKAVANRVRTSPITKHIPIVAVSANTTTKARQLAIAFGCNGFIEKPIDTREFPQQVASFLSSSEE